MIFKSFNIVRYTCLVFILSIVETSLATDLPKYSLQNMTYIGAFRLPHGTFGDSRVVDSGGPIVVDESRGSFFFTGSNRKSIAEFKLPAEIIDSDKISDLIMVAPPIQNFHNIIHRAEGGNPNDVNRITGLGLIDGKLVVNAAVYYDGSGSNYDTTLIIEDPSDLEKSLVRGFMQLEGAVHAAGWISAVPDPYIQTFDGEYIFGHSNNLPINSRNSIGPTAFSVRKDGLLASQRGDSISTNRLLDFSVSEKLHSDLLNQSLENDLWTEESQATYGFIVEGTSTYLTIGQSGGHKSEIGYKLGPGCGGFCPTDPDDYYNYIWLWDVKDLEASYDGTIKPSDIRPYYYGEISLPFQTPEKDVLYAEHRVIGATSTKNGKLYIVLDEADKLQSAYSSLPIILVYDLSLNTPNAPQDFRITN